MPKPFFCSNIPNIFYKQIVLLHLRCVLCIYMMYQIWNFNLICISVCGEDSRSTVVQINAITLLKYFWHWKLCLFVLCNSEFSSYICVCRCYALARFDYACQFGCILFRCVTRFKTNSNYYTLGDIRCTHS